MVAHVGILLGALALSLVFDIGSSLPTEFVVGELSIIAICGFLTVRVPELRAYALKAAAPGTRPVDGRGTDEGVSATNAEKVAGVALIGAFIVQFAALASLLWATGGPIESPFAEMTLAIAVFTPFLANRGETVGSVVAASIVYYALLTLVYSGSHPRPETRIAFEKAYAMTHPSVWAYFWVNVMILVGAITFTMYESLARQAAVSRSMESGGVKEGDIKSQGGDAAVDNSHKDGKSSLVVEDENDTRDGAVAGAESACADDPSSGPEVDGGSV
jgi:hypothetical protein